MIKLIVTDVDDTLIRETGTNLNPEYYEVIEKLVEKGIIFAAASGRQGYSIDITFRPVLDKICVLADNGTDIYSADFKKSFIIPTDYYQELVTDLKKTRDRYGIMYCVPSIAYVYEEHTDFHAYMNAYPYNLKLMEDPADFDDITKISLWRYDGIEDDVDEFFKVKYGEKLDVVRAGTRFLDFMTKGINKGYAVKVLQEHYGITPEETMTFGNGDNDIPMIRQSKYGYAVAGASPALKENAYEVIGAMEEDAVLKKLKELLEELS